MTANENPVRTKILKRVLTLLLLAGLPALLQSQPFGYVDGPTSNSTGWAGAINVTGWTLSSNTVATVKIYRDPVLGEGSGLVFIGDAPFVAGARPDVGAAFPSYPNNDWGWGMQILTNMLPGTGGQPRGNGTYTLHAIACDPYNTCAQLPSGTSPYSTSIVITVDNQNSPLPFGTIDTPAQGESASGTGYINFGWVLAPQPNYIPTDGSTITVYIDGVAVGDPVYNQYRSDIASLFPGLQNSDGAGGYLSINTTQLAAGLHSIAWGVYDNVGHSAGIGSRNFSVPVQTGSSNSNDSLWMSQAAQPSSTCDLRIYGYCWSENLTITRPDTLGTRIYATVQPYIWAGTTQGVTLYYQAKLFLGGNPTFGSGIEVASSGAAQAVANGGTLYIPGPGANNTIDAATNGFGTYWLQITTYGIRNNFQSRVFGDRSVTRQVVPTIRIFRNGSEVLDPPNVIVGQKITLHGTEGADGGAVVTRRSWTVENYTAIGGYSWTQDGSSASVTPFQDSGTQDQSMYLPTGGVASVTYTVVYKNNGYYAVRQVMFVAAKPTVPQIDAHFMDNPVQFKNVPGLDWVLSLGAETGTEETSVSGISAFAQVTPPTGGDGELTFVQLARARHTATADDGTTQDVVSTGGVFVADGTIPYADTTFPVTGPSGTAGFGDRPEQARIVNSITRVEIADDFQLFLMYRPSGADSIWITLKEIDWGWSAVISHTAGTSWTENAFESTPSLRGPTIMDSSVQPIWTGKRP